MSRLREESSAPCRIVFLLVPGVHLLDLSGPAQVFSTADVVLRADGAPGYDLHFVGDSAQVTSAQGLALRAETTWPELSPADLVVVPGWRVMTTFAGRGPVRAESLDRLRSHHAAGGTVASICAGADALGRAGLLDGRRCTTHHELQDSLARRYPRAHVLRDVLYTDDDRVVSSAGIASGIDLALYLVAQRDGPALAARVARTMVVFARRNGDAQQMNAMLRHRQHLDDAVHRVQDLIDAQFARPLSLAELAALARMSPRSLTRAFDRAMALTPLRYQQVLRLEHAQHLVGAGATLESAAREVGFTDARMLRRLRGREAAKV